MPAACGLESMTSSQRAALRATWTRGASANCVHDPPASRAVAECCSRQRLVVGTANGAPAGIVARASRRSARSAPARAPGPGRLSARARRVAERRAQPADVARERPRQPEHDEQEQPEHGSALRAARSLQARMGWIMRRGHPT